MPGWQAQWFFDPVVITILVKLAPNGIYGLGTGGDQQTDGFDLLRGLRNVPNGFAHPVGIVHNEKEVFLLACEEITLFATQSVLVEVQETDTRRLRLLLKVLGQFQKQPAFALPSGGAQDQCVASAGLRECLQFRKCISPRHKRDRVPEVFVCVSEVAPEELLPIQQWLVTAWEKSLHPVRAEKPMDQIDGILAGPQDRNFRGQPGGIPPAPFSMLVDYRLRVFVQAASGHQNKLVGLRKAPLRQLNG